MLTRILTVVCLFLSISVAHAQNSAKSAYKQYKKGNLEKANKLLDEIESKGEQALPYYYVKTLCVMESAATPEDYKRALHFILKSDPRSIIDPKESKSLNKIYELNGESYDELLSNFYRQVFLAYKSWNTAELWLDHNAVFAFSTERDSAFLYEAKTVYDEIDATIEEYGTFYTTYLNGKYTEEIALEAYRQRVNLEFLKADENGDPELLFDFAYRYQKESQFKPLVERASAKAVNNDEDSKRLLKFANSFNSMGFDSMVSDAYLKAFNIDYSVLELEVDSGTLSIQAVKEFTLNYANQTEACEAIRNDLDSLTFLRLTTNFDTDIYAAYTSNFPSSKNRGSLDSLLNTSIYRIMMGDDLNTAQELHERFHRPESSYGYDVIQGLINNQTLSYIPALNEYDSYSFMRIDHKSLSSDVNEFKAEVILRDGYSLFRFKDSEGWGVVQINENGKVKVLFRCDEVSVLTSNLYLTKSGDTYSVIATNGEVLATSDNTPIQILPTGNILVPGSKSTIIDPWDKSKVEIDYWVSTFTFPGSYASSDYFLSAHSGTRSNDILALYNMAGEKVISGRKLEFERAIGTVQNLLVDGKRYVLHEDSIFKNPVNKYLIFYQDEENMIYASRDESYNGGTMTIIKDNTKETLVARWSSLHNDVIGFQTDNGVQIYGLNSLTKIPLASIENYKVVNGDVLAQSEFGFVSLYKQGPSGWYSPVTLNTANGLYYEEEYYGELSDDPYYTEGGDPFYISNDNNYYETAKGLSFNKANFKTPSVYPVLINDFMEYVNDQGKLIGPNYFRSASDFNAPYTQASDSKYESIIINSSGDDKVKGYLEQWVSSNEFIYSEGNKSYKYDVRTKLSNEICSDCSVLQKIQEDLYEIKVDGNITYLQTGGSGKFFGTYLSSEDHTIRAHLSKLYDYWWEDSYRNHYEYMNHLDEIKVYKEANKYILAKVKLKLALALDKDKIPEAVSELENFDQEYFSDDERAEIYNSVASRFYNSDDYQNAILYYGLLSTINPEEFNSSYAYQVAECYAGIYDYENAEKYYIAWGGTLDEPAHYTTIAGMYKDAGYSSKAIEYYKKYAAIGESERAYAMDNVGHLYFDEGNYSYAASSWKQCIRYYQKQDNDYMLGLLYYNIAASYQNNNMSSSACKYYSLASNYGRSVPYWYNYNCNSSY